MKTERFALLVAAIFIAGACTQQPPAGTQPGGRGDQNVGGTGDQKSDWAGIVKLEDEAKSIARANGCTADGQCRTAPVGSRACGGPRYYLVYCAATTDSVALFRKLDEVAAAERAYNAKNNVASTCEFRMPPTVGATAGSCQARQ